MSFTSSTASLPDGNEIFFIDTGKPPNVTNYLTILFLHGSAFHCRGFNNLIPCAPSRGVRVILVQRKEYPGSTRYTDSEVEDLKNGRKVALDRLGLMMAHLLNYFVQNLSIPKPSDDSSTGGFAIAGWSMGIATIMPLLSDLTVIPEELHPMLSNYINCFVFYDPPYLSFGIELPEDDKTYNPWADPDCKTPQETYQNFTHWVSSYFDIPPNWSGDVNDLDHRKRSEHTTFSSWTGDEISQIYDHDAAIRTELLMYVNPMQKTLRELTRRTLFDEIIVSESLPSVPVIYIDCKRTSWHSAWASHEIRKMAREHVEKGVKVRSLQFVEIPLGNHFAHIDCPNDLLQAVIDGTRQCSPRKHA